ADLPPRARPARRVAGADRGRAGARGRPQPRPGRADDRLGGRGGAAPRLLARAAHHRQAAHRRPPLRAARVRRLARGDEARARARREVISLSAGPRLCHPRHMAAVQTERAAPGSPVATLLPGRAYGVQAPLLYYTSMLLRSRGWA